MKTKNGTNFFKNGTATQTLLKIQFHMNIRTFKKYEIGTNFFKNGTKKKVFYRLISRW